MRSSLFVGEAFRTRGQGAGNLRNHLIELVVVFVGVALAFAVENFREDLGNRSVEAQYLRGFRQDLLQDAEMLQAERKARQAQMENSLAVLEFFEGRPVDPQAFFERYYSVLWALHVAPSRNTMDEVLGSGSLRLIRDARVRTGLLDLYATYARISFSEEHMARDFDEYLYNTTFSSIPIQFYGPWEDTPANRRAVEILLGNLTVENGFRLVVANLDYESGGLLKELETAQSQVEALLQIIPAD